MQQPDYDKPRKEGVLVQLILFMSRFFWAAKHDMNRLEKLIMATQAEIVTQLTQVKAQITKVKTEVVDARTELVETIARLQAIIDAGNTGEASQALVDVVAELKDVSQTLDDLNVDKPEVPKV